MSTVKTYDAPPLNRREILRYAGAKEETPELAALLDECLAEIGDSLCYKVAYAAYQPLYEEWSVDLGFAEVTSADLLKNLEGADAVIVFCATVGIGIDRLIAKYTRISPAKALLMEAIGNERVESLCDLFCAEQNAAGPRFSPGYGDFPLEVQKDIFLALDCPRKIGVTLCENLLMTPQKSVTALLGIKK